MRYLLSGSVKTAYSALLRVNFAVLRPNEALPDLLVIVPRINSVAIDELSLKLC